MCILSESQVQGMQALARALDTVAREGGGRGSAAQGGREPEGGRAPPTAARATECENHSNLQMEGWGAIWAIFH